MFSNVDSSSDAAVLKYFYSFQSLEGLRNPCGLAGHQINIKHLVPFTQPCFSCCF